LATSAAKGLLRQPPPCPGVNRLEKQVNATTCQQDHRGAENQNIEEIDYFCVRMMEF
jgi:hypothetical protein